MKIAELKSIAESIGRFASVREGAKTPTNQIVVQAAVGTVKIVAGADYGTIIAIAHDTTQDFKAVVSSREFLTTIKGLPAKKNVEFVDLNLGFAVGCSLVDEDTGEVYMDFLRVSKSLPQYLMPPSVSAQSQGTVKVDGKDLEEMGRIFESVTDKFMPGVSVYGKIATLDDTVMFTGWDGYKWASHTIGPSNYEIFGSILASTLNSARDIGDCTMEFWTDGKVVMENDRYRVIGQYVMLNRAAPLAKPLPEPDHNTVVDRLGFTKSVREAAKFDTHGRVGIYLESNVLKVTTYDKHKHGWLAMADKLIPVFTALKVKKVGLSLRNGFGLPISVRVPNWRIEIAQVELSKKN